MNRAEVAKLLAYAAAFDRRTIGDADVLAWHDVLDRTPYEPAKDAVREWYRVHDQPIMPANVIAGVRGSEASRHPSARPAAEVLAEQARVAMADAGPYRREWKAMLDDLAARRTLPGEPSPGQEAAG